MKANKCLIKAGLIEEGFNNFIIKLNDKETDLGELMEEYATYRIALHEMKMDIHKEISKWMQVFEVNEKSFSFKEGDTDTKVVLRYGSWKTLPIDLFEKLRLLYPAIWEDCYDDDDGDDDEGRPIIRHLYSYVIPVEVPLNV